MLRVSGISVQYQDGPTAVKPFHDLSFDIDSGQAVAVTGPSGSGKSSLLRVLAGLQAPSSGTVVLDGEPIHAVGTRAAIDERVAMVHQDYRLVDFLTVEQNLRLAAEFRGRLMTKGDVSNILAVVGLGGFGARLPETLSGGQQQRVACARAMSLGATLLLADEPTGALDAENSRELALSLLKVAAQGVVVVVATHDAEVAALLPRRLVLR